MINSNNVNKEDINLYVRYPGTNWTLFDINDASIRHQKIGLDMLIESGKDSLEISIPHSVYGIFNATYEKVVSNFSDRSKEFILYYYINANMDTIQMMYTVSSYIDYINQLTM